MNSTNKDESVKFIDPCASLPCRPRFADRVR